MPSDLLDLFNAVFPVEPAIVRDSDPIKGKSKWGHWADCSCHVCKPKTLREKYNERVVIQDACWGWRGTRTPTGYGVIPWKGATISAHRASWVLHYGEIPDGMFVCHTCDNPTCSNPAHLFIGTAQQNSLDMIAKGRHNNQYRSRNHCSNGHKYQPETTSLTKSGHRVCLICQRIAWHKVKKHRRNRAKRV